MVKRYIGEYALLMAATSLVLVANNGVVTAITLWGIGIYAYWIGQRDLKKDIESGKLAGDYQCTDAHQRWLDEKRGMKV